MISNHSEFDEKSIMLYGGSRKDCMKYPSPPQPYMTLKSGQEIPENKKLSVLDIKALKKLYEPPSK